MPIFLKHNQPLDATQGALWQWQRDHIFFFSGIINFMTPLEEQLLMTLSHLEAMTLDKIFIDLDKDFVLQNTDISMEDVTKCLDNLVKQKKVKCLDNQGHKEWIKVFPKRKALWRRLLDNFFIF
jgi:hypothetical protein